jgi:FtsP/CotA-like multicopper oxidase with cupredoxin domain
MQTITRNTLKLILALVVLTAMFGAGISSSVAYAASCTTPDISYDLWAMPGTASLNGITTVNIWGFSSTSGGPASLPGPVLEATVGQCVGVTLHNALPETLSLLFQGQELIPDTTGAASGSSVLYTFIASSPGTFLYEAGLTSNSQHQVAMGLYGALIVHPTAVGQAYDAASTAFTKEYVLILSELDTTLNNSATPDTFDIRNFSPQYFLINGKAYLGTDPNPYTVDPGDKVLLRYVNAGLQAHAMSTLGLSQTIIAQDGSPYALSHNVVAETIATGQTLDTIVTIPASAAQGTRFAVYDANMLLHNDRAASLGGMLTFLTVGTGTPPPPVDTGPTVSGLSLSPNPTSGLVDVIVSATVTDGGTTATNISAAEFYIDSTAGTATAMTPTDSAFDSSSESVTGMIPMATLGSLSSGYHTIYVRGADSATPAPLWGPFLSIKLNLDKTGPATSGLSLTPNPSSGAEPVVLTATGNDSTTGNSNVTAAEYWVDGGTPTAMTLVGSPSPISSFTATIPAPLSMGAHTVSVRSQDAFGNWGAVATITLQVTDTAAPTTSNVIASPNPNNGNQPYNTSVPAVRVTADFSDVATGSSNIAAAEGFLNTAGTTGTGFAFIATDGSFSSPTESGYGDIPLAVIGALSNGNHTIYVHAKDAAGNWGAFDTTILVITKSLYFSTSGNSNPPGVGGTADDADIYLWNGSFYSRVVDASADGLPSSGGSNANVDGFDRVDDTHFYMSFTGNTSVPGIAGTVADEDVVYYNAGSWSLYFDGSANGLTSNSFDLDAISIVGGTLYFSTDNGNVPPGAGGAGDDADIYRWNGGSSFTRVVDASVLPSPLSSDANVDGLTWVDTTHFYLSFTADTSVPGLGTVQDEDVVYYNNGTWIVYFDGTAHGLTSNNLDIDAFDIP